jgi:hypothetical protein
MSGRSDRKILAVGWFDNAPFTEICARRVSRIKEVFFAWPGVLSCRPAPEFTEELRRRLIADLLWARSNGIELDTLFNCNCYGDVAISRELRDFVVRMLGEMDSAGVFPDTVTTTSPFIATVLRREFPSLKIRGSVNLRIHGTLGFEPVAELFDSFYASREHHRSVGYLRRMREWADANGKTFGVQANSGCLRQCPFQQFHDNLHGHNRIAQSKAGEEFDFSVFRCKTHYARGNFEDFLRATWLRPEDMPIYEPYVDVVKLATRRHPYPEKVINAYADCAYDGNLADLMDPVHEFPKPFDNTLIGSSPLWPEVRDCPHADNCLHCGRCARLSGIF